MSQSSVFTVFGTLKQTFSVIRKEFLFFAVTMIVYFIFALLPFYMFDSGIDFETENGLTEFENKIPVLLGLTLFVYLWFAATVIVIVEKTRLTLNLYNEEKHSFIKRAVIYAFPVLFLFFITVVFSYIGLVFFIIPGFFIFSSIYLSIPAMLAENINPFMAIGQSWRLSKGHRLRIMGVILINVILLFVIAIPLILMVILLDKQIINTAIQEEFITTSIFTASTMGITVSVLTLSVSSCVIYHQLARSSANVDEEAFD